MGANSFLGEGAFGLVFRVRNKDGKILALKLVPDESDNVEQLERQRSLTLEAKAACPLLLVGIEEDGFMPFPGQGTVLLQSEAGEDYSNLTPKQIVDSLTQLHKNNILHGDCRVENVVCVDGKPRWIDFCSPHFPLSQAKEMEALKQSIRCAFDFN